MGQERLGPHSLEAPSAAGCAAGGEAIGTALSQLGARSGNSRRRSATEQEEGAGLPICQSPGRWGMGVGPGLPGRHTMAGHLLPAQDAARGCRGPSGTALTGGGYTGPPSNLG